MDHYHEKKTINDTHNDPVCGMAVTGSLNFMNKLAITPFTFVVKNVR